MITKKNWGLTMILALLVIIYFFMLSNDGKGDSLATTNQLPSLAIADTSAITSIVLKPVNGSPQNFTRAGLGWEINNTIEVDNRYMLLLQSVLVNLEAVRPVAESQQSTINNLIKNSGVEVTVTGNDTYQFIASGDDQSKISYITKAGKTYVVQLPGYNSYVYSIFNQPIEQVRNKTIFSLNSNNFLSLQLSYPEASDRDFTIYFEKNKLGVENMDEPDSTTLFGYMSLYEPVEAIAFIPKEQAGDYMQKADLLAKITAKTLTNLKGKELWVYNLPLGQQGQLAYLPAEEQAVVLDTRLAKALLISRQNLQEGISN